MTDEQIETRGEILRQLDDLAEIGGLHLPFAHELRARLARVDAGVHHMGSTFTAIRYQDRLLSALVMRAGSEKTGARD